jgi:cytochrome P450
MRAAVRNVAERSFAVGWITLPMTMPVSTELEFDPFAATYLEDPYPSYPALRDGKPFYEPGLDMWVVSRFADVDAVFRDSATFSAAIAQDPLTPFSPEARAILAAGFAPRKVMSNADVPDHARIRQHTTRAFSARRMALLEPVIRERAAALIDAFAAADEVDLIPALAFPLPAVTIFTMIGFPNDDIEQLKAWCGDRLSMTWGRPLPADQRRVAQQMVAYWQYCVAFVERRAVDLADDFTSDLLRTAAEDGTLSHAEIASIIYGLSFAGHETTTNLIANTVRRVLETDGTWRGLADGSISRAAVVEEALRHDTSVVAWRRVARVATQVGGVAVPAGAKMLLLLAAANHDPARFPDPERFDPLRSNARAHLAFGMGIHYCLGAALARLEVAIVLELLVARFPALRLVPDQRYAFAPNISFRGPSALRLALRGA